MWILWKDFIVKTKVDWTHLYSAWQDEVKNISNERLFRGICGEDFALKRRLTGHIAKVHARNSSSEENSNDQIGKKLVHQK